MLCGTESLLAQPAAAPVEWPRDRLPTAAEIRKMHPYLWFLVDRINEVREQHRLPAVPLSPRLTLVAKTHVEDLARHSPHKDCGNNLHAWSRNGTWKGGCFLLADKTTYPVMWDKPKELAQYASPGYEIAASGTLGDKPHLDYDQAMKAWRGSPAHENVILNKDIWKDRAWKAVGAAIAYGYACAWFGQAPDA